MVENTGTRIKQLRLSKKISMSQLSKDVHVTRSLLSQVESGQALPSLPTLGKIVEALGVSLSEFFDMDTTEDLLEEDIIVRKDSRRMVSIPETKSRYQMLTPNMNNKLEFFISEFPPYMEFSETMASVHKAEECFYVVNGTVQLRLGESTYELTQGDSGAFDSGIPHGFSNPGCETAKVLFAIRLQ